MKIIIAGAGKIGSSVARILTEEGHDVTIIDINEARIKEMTNSLDIICLEGSATSPETLREAGAEEADLLMAAMRSDEANMVCGIAARRLGTKHVIARIRDTEYLRQTEFLREVLGLSQIVNPEYNCAKEISRMLHFPSAIRVDAFSKGSAEIIEHRVSPGSRLDGLQLKDLGQSFRAKVLVGVVERQGEAMIPNGDFVLKAGDLLSITGSDRELRRFFMATGQYMRPVRDVMIMGGGRIAVYLSRMLLESGMTVTIVESDRDRCQDLCDLVPQANIIWGDATRSEVLREEGISSADASVALTGDDGDNMIISMYAKHMGVGKIVVKVNRDYYQPLLDSAGLDSVVAPKTLVSQQLARYVRAMSNSIGSSMETLYRLADGRVEALEFKVGEGSACLGIPLRDLALKPDIIISAIVRGNKTILPGGDTQILPGDHAVVVTKAGWLKDLDDILDGGA